MPYGISPHPSLLCGVRQISTNVANLLKRANALSFASRLGRGVAPLDALFLSLPRVLSAERGGRIRARRFSPFSSFYAPLTSLLVSSHLLRIVLLTVALRRWRLLLRSPSTARALGVLRLCGGASLCGAKVSPSRPQGERKDPLWSIASAKEKGLRTRRKPLRRCKRGDNTTSANGSSMDDRRSLITTGVILAPLFYHSRGRVVNSFVQSSCKKVSVFARF